MFCVYNYFYAQTEMPVTGQMAHSKQVSCGLELMHSTAELCYKNSSHLDMAVEIYFCCCCPVFVWLSLSSPEHCIGLSFTSYSNSLGLSFTFCSNLELICCRKCSETLNTERFTPSQGTSSIFQNSQKVIYKGEKVHLHKGPLLFSKTPQR